MKASEVIRKIMKSKNITQSALTDRLHLGRNVLNERLNQKNLSVSKVNEMLRAMDYKLVAVPRDKRLSDGDFEVE